MPRIIEPVVVVATTVVAELGSCVVVGAGVSGKEAFAGLTEASSRSRSVIRAEVEVGGEKKLVGLLERRRRVLLWPSNAILYPVYNPNRFQIVRYIKDGVLSCLDGPVTGAEATA